jgi:hypothetical protein
MIIHQVEAELLIVDGPTLVERRRVITGILHFSFSTSKHYT